MSQGSKAMAIFQRLERERAEAEARRGAASEDLARSSTKQAFKTDKN